MDYIIYSAGARGFSFYNSSTDFPEAYMRDLTYLYEHSRIVESASEYTTRGVRFAPLQDKYVLSVLYRKCFAPEESRLVIAGLNWILEPKEVDNLFSNDIADNFNKLFEKSDKFLLDNGYQFELSPDDLQYVSSDFSNDKMRTLLSSVIATYESMPSNDAQVFVGCKEMGEAYESLFWLLNQLPVSLKKDISFYVGAVTGSETQDVALVLMKDTLLGKIASNGYSGTVPKKKIAFNRGDIVSAVTPPEQTSTFLCLSDKEKALLKKIFEESNNVNAFWKCVNCIEGLGKSSRGNIDFLLALGDELAVKFVKEFVDENFILSVYKNRKLIANSPRLLFYIEDTAKAIIKRQEEKKKEEEEKEKRGAELLRQKNPQKELEKPKESVNKPVDKKKKEKNKKEKNNDNKKTEVKNMSIEADNATPQNSFTNLLEKCSSISHLAVVVLAAFVMLSLDILFLILILDVSFNDMKPQFSFEAISLKRYIVTILGLNVVNIPMGYILISSLVESLRARINRK